MSTNDSTQHRRILACGKFAGFHHCSYRAVDPSEFVRSWFAQRARLLRKSRTGLYNTSHLDRLADRPVGTFARFLAGQEHVTLKYGPGLADYYPALALIGCFPVPGASLATYWPELAAWDVVNTPR